MAKKQTNQKEAEKMTKVAFSGEAVIGGEKMEWSKAKEIAREAGYEVQGNVNKHTELVVSSNEESQRHQRAVKRGLPIIGWKRFSDLIEARLND